MDPENCILMEGVYVLCSQIFSHSFHAKLLGQTDFPKALSIKNVTFFSFWLFSEPIRKG